MKFSIQQKSFMEALQLLKGTVSEKGLVPILQYVYIETKKDSLLLQANNLKIGVATELPAIVEEDGKVCLLGKMLIDIVSKLPSVLLDVEVNERNRAKIKAGLSEIELQGESPDDFPKPNLHSVSLKGYISPEQLEKAITQTIVASAKEELRQVLTGVLIESKDGVVNFVGVDGHRLAMMKVNTEIEEFSVIVPAKNLQELSKILSKKSPEFVGISLTENQIVFSTEDIYFTSQLLSGQFPNYSQIIAQDYSVGFACNRKDLVNSLERLRIISSTENSETIKITLQDGEVILSTLVMERGAGKEKIEAEVSQKEFFEIGFNPEYLLDCLKSIDYNTIEFHFTSELGPAMIKSHEDENYLYIVMPVKL